ncbi:MAG: hypothetical protein CMI54_00200 [Parcubacteria group bacterium]|nr:hypothetical protein [Parcubacteria group bacterium]|tara:strand:- start:16102 stop:16497 length:396 start_codon:yes stop_codon:yes gene_type:complete
MAQKKKSTKKVAAKAKNKQKTMESLSQTHGKEEKFEPTTLEQVWGEETGLTKYGTTDVNDYIRKLDEMNKSDLQAHAHYVGFVPVDDRVSLTKKLITEFKKYVSGFQKPSTQPIPNSPVTDEVNKILSEGR